MAVSSQGPPEATGGRGVSRCQCRLALSVGRALWACFSVARNQDSPRPGTEWVRHSQDSAGTGGSLFGKVFTRNKAKGEQKCSYSCPPGLRTGLACGFQSTSRFPADVGVVWKPGDTAGCASGCCRERTVVAATCPHGLGCSLSSPASDRQRVPTPDRG